MANSQSVAGGFLSRDSQLLLAKRAPELQYFPNVWDLVGGHSEPNEPPAETLVREMQEELGISPTAYEALSVLHIENESGTPGVELHIFLVTSWDGGEPRCLGDEHTELRWFTPKRALALDNLAHVGYRPILEELMCRMETDRADI